MAILQAEVNMLDSPGVETLRAADGRTMTLLFQQLGVVVGEGHAPLATRTASFRIPVSANAGGSELCLLLRGVATLPPGSRGVLLVYQGGDHLLLELPRPPCRQREFRQRFPTRLAPGADCRITVFLLVERAPGATGEAPSLALESLDLSVPGGEHECRDREGLHTVAPVPWSPPPVAWPTR